MENELRIDELPTLRRPVLIAAFRGWNDGGQAATLAGGTLARVWERERFADIDPEGFVDFQATRPTVSLDEGLTRQIEWPETTSSTRPRSRAPTATRSSCSASSRTTAGAPSTSSSSGSHAISASSSSSRSARCSPTCRTRGPAPVTGAASDPSLVEELGLQPSRYEGPTGIVGVLHDACREAGIPSVSLWSAVPHYVSLAPSPRAARALCDRLGELLGVTIDLAELEEAEEVYAEQISEAVASDPETAAYVEELERRADTIDELIDEAELPTGESLAAELTRFLRDRETRRAADRRRRLTAAR